MKPPTPQTVPLESFLNMVQESKWGWETEAGETLGNVYLMGSPYSLDCPLPERFYPIVPEVRLYATILEKYGAMAEAIDSNPVPRSED